MFFSPFSWFLAEGVEAAGVYGIEPPNSARILPAMSIVRAAEVVVLLCTVYIACGLVFAPFFVWRGVGRVDPAAKSAGLGFRLIVLPGVAALWPALLRRWLADRPPAAERNAHRDAASARPARGSR